MLTSVMEDLVEGDKLSETPGDDEESVKDTTEVKVTSPQVEGAMATLRHKGRPRKDKASPTGGNIWAKCKQDTQQFAQ
ncbi:hypothetical protein R1flu_018909 [Riccia fluitans]|uniref:Uncharacterized protein n=1 Tax=Riccia fluitans TaxID=41844 RepID=A0ABD1ZJF9_9MARC